MVGGLIYGLLMRESSEHTLRLATAVAALAVSQSNVGITDRTVGRHDGACRLKTL
jgi:1-phosphofructokinase